jgi:hypothetical protein
MSADTVEGMYGQLAERRFREAAGTLEHALAEPQRAEGMLGEMAVALGDAAAVLAVLAVLRRARACARGDGPRGGRAGRARRAARAGGRPRPPVSGGFRGPPRGARLIGGRGARRA